MLGCFPTGAWIIRSRILDRDGTTPWLPYWVGQWAA